MDLVSNNEIVTLQPFRFLLLCRLGVTKAIERGCIEIPGKLLPQSHAHFRGRGGGTESQEQVNVPLFEQQTSEAGELTVHH